MTEEDLLERLRVALLRAKGAAPHVTRLRVEVALEDDRHELITFMLKGDSLRMVCSDAQAEPSLKSAAFKLFTAATGAPMPQELGTSILSMSEATATTSGRAVTDGDLSLGECLRDVVTAVARLGAEEAPESPSLNAALTRMLETAPEPLPFGLTRWIGRLAYTLEHGDATTQASVLLGAGLTSKALESSPDNDPDRRLLVWVGERPLKPGQTERLQGRELVELGRERLTGLKLHGLERRYLLDLKTGETFKEEHRTEDGHLSAGASAGPSPRQIHLDLGEVEVAGVPRRIHLLQYRVTIGIEPDTLSKLQHFATRDFSGMAELMAQSLGAFPALAEPVALIAPAKVETMLWDDKGKSIAMTERERTGNSQLLRKLALEEEVQWVFGRLLEERGQLTLAPISACVGSKGQRRHCRLS